MCCEFNVEFFHINDNIKRSLDYMTKLCTYFRREPNHIQVIVLKLQTKLCIKRQSISVILIGFTLVT